MVNFKISSQIYRSHNIHICAWNPIRQKLSYCVNMKGSGVLICLVQIELFPKYNIYVALTRLYRHNTWCVCALYLPLNPYFAAINDRVHAKVYFIVPE